MIDVNDRALRNTVIGLGGRLDGVPRETGFDITAASEVMATLALCTSLQDLRERLGRIVVGYTKAGTPVTAEELEVAGAMAVILREAIKPNLMQTLENTPALVHTGPFGNIATGNSSIVADRIGIHMGDYLITEAGFGADMGAERFFNIKCRCSGLAPDAAVLVATVRGLKAHSGNHKIVAGKPLPEDLLEGEPRRGPRGRRQPAQAAREHAHPRLHPGRRDQRVPRRPRGRHRRDQRDRRRVRRPRRGVDPLRRRRAGAVELAHAVAEAADEPSDFQVLYPDEMPLRDKIRTVATKVYGAADVEFSPQANKQLDTYEAPASATCRSASPRPTCRSPPTPR